VKFAATAALLTSTAYAAQTQSLQDLAADFRPREAAKIFVAREFITMDPKQPRAGAVAVVNGRVAAIGGLEELRAIAALQSYVIDETFSDTVVVAGFVEQHVHPVLAALTMMASAVISIEDWDAVSGFSPAVREQAGYAARLKKALAAHDPSDGTFLTWGYHHYFHGQMSRTVLDQAAPEVAVVVWHRSCHEFFPNSKAMKTYGIDAAFFETFSPSQREQSNFEQGHFYEQGAMKLLERLSPAVATPERLKKGLEYTKTYYLQQGITVCCEPAGCTRRRCRTRSTRSMARTARRSTTTLSPTENRSPLFIRAIRQR
jgi:predicted amidohydrolase YtcJ